MKMVIEDEKKLNEISIYRKLGIDLKTIQNILSEPQQKEVILKNVISDKRRQIDKEKQQIVTIERLLEFGDICLVDLNQQLQYETIFRGLQEMLPGFYGNYFMHHFRAFLNESIQTTEQQEAYQTILNYFDQVQIKEPWYFKANYYLTKWLDQKCIETVALQMQEQIQQYLNPSHEQYERLKMTCLKGYKMQQNSLYKYSFSRFYQRKMMQRLKECGYDDVLLPNMEKLSPSYKEYRKSLKNINKRVYEDLGLTYDEKYNLVIDIDKK